MTLPRLLLLLLSLTFAVMVVGGVVALVEESAPDLVLGEHTPGGLVGSLENDGPMDVLRDWDVRRARAWARGDVEGLGALYVAGSRAGVRDRAMLRRWLARGLRVEDLQTQLLEARVTSGSDKRIELVVTDRLVGGVAVAGRWRAVLPRDEASTHRITMRRVAGWWRVAAVRALS